MAEINALDQVVVECAREIAAQDAGSDFAALIRIVDAQAAEIERLQVDAKRIDWMSTYEARIGWNREGDMCRVWVREDEDDTGNFVPVCGWKIAFEDPRSAIDAAMRTCDSSKRRDDVAAKLQEQLDRNVAKLEAERNTARGAVRELEQQVFTLQQQCNVLQTCIDSHQRDIKDPPGYLQDAVIRAAGLGALHEQRDAAVKERDALRAWKAEMEAQEPVAWIEQITGRLASTGDEHRSRFPSVYSPLYVRPPVHMKTACSAIDAAMQEPIG